MTDLPLSLPFPRFKAAIEALDLGDDVKGVYRITVSSDGVVVEQFRKTEDGRTVTMGRDLALVTTSIPFEHDPQPMFADDGVGA